MVFPDTVAFSFRLQDLDKVLANYTVPPRLPFYCDRWVARSCLQKAIRRGDVGTALSSLATLMKQPKNRVWRDLIIIGLEDVQCPAWNCSSCFWQPHGLENGVSCVGEIGLLRRTLSWPCAPPRIVRQHATSCSQHNFERRFVESDSSLKVDGLTSWQPWSETTHGRLSNEHWLR